MQETLKRTPEKKVTSQVYFLTVTAVLTALTYIFTAFINVRLPIAANGGLVHLGNVPLFFGSDDLWTKDWDDCRRHRNGAV